jgi:hypothetical protein
MMGKCLSFWSQALQRLAFMGNAIANFEESGFIFASSIGCRTILGEIFDVG